MFCRYCGKETAGKFLYCPFCGKNQNEEVENTQQVEVSKNTGNQVNSKSQSNISSTGNTRKGNNAVSNNNIVHIPREPKIQYAIAVIIMIIILLNIRLDFILSIPVFLVVVLLSDVIVKLISPALPLWPTNKTVIEEMNGIEIPILNHLETKDIKEIQRRIGSSYKVQNEQTTNKVSIDNKRCEYIVDYNTDNSCTIQIKEKKTGLWIEPIVDDYVRIANQIQMLCNKGVPHNELKPIITEKNKMEIKDYGYIIVEAVLCIIAIGLLYTKNYEYKIIESVQKTVQTIDGYKYSYGDALEKYCDETSWDYYKDDNVHVTFKGKCKLPEGEDSGILFFDWVIDDMGIMSIYSIKFNGKELEAGERIKLLAEACGYSLPEKTSTGNDTDSKAEKKNESVASAKNDSKTTPTPVPELDIVEGGVEDFVGSYTGYKGEAERCIYVSKEGANTYVLDDGDMSDLEDYMYYGKYDSTKKAVFFYKYELVESGWTDYGEWAQNITKRGECSGYMYTYGDGTLYVVFDKEKYSPNHDVSMICFKNSY